MSKSGKIIRRIIGLFQRPNNVSAEIKILDHVNLLKGKGIVITGGTRGLGRAMATKFVQYGADVLITGRNDSEVIEKSREIGCKGLKLNLQDINTFDDFIDMVTQKMVHLDCLVNNAGVSLHEDSFLNVTPDGWDIQFNTNLKGPFFLTQKFVKYMTDNNRIGNILFISSETGNTVDIRPYGYTKASINSMVEGLAFLFKNKGIRINALAPGITASNMTGISSNENLYAESYGQGRFYLPEEIAEVAAFLLSDVSDCISGQIITCNNAQTVNARWKK